jgi:hypothetical protein
MSTVLRTIKAFHILLETKKAHETDSHELRGVIVSIIDEELLQYAVSRQVHYGDPLQF